MAKQLDSIEIHPGENGGHRVVHNFKSEATKKEGAMNGGLYMERPKSEEHLFGASEGSKVLPPHRKGARAQGTAQAERREYGG